MCSRMIKASVKDRKRRSILDLCIGNARILYKRDRKTQKEKHMPPKTFRLIIPRFASCEKAITPRLTHLSLEHKPLKMPKRSQKTQLLHDYLRYDTKECACPLWPTDKPGSLAPGRMMYTELTGWALCLFYARKCLVTFHAFPGSTSRP